MADIANRAKQVAKEDAERIKVLAQDAIQSRAYLYPIKGIYYFVSHKDLWRPMWSKLAPTLTTAIGVTTAMFVLTYVPQAAALSLFNGPLAFASTIMLVLSESSTLTNVITKTFFIEDALLDTFDGTLISKNQTEIVKEGRSVTSGSDSISRLGKLAKKPFAKFTPSAIIRYFMYLPLNFIPIVGTVLFIIMNGRRFGPNAHARYFQLKGMSKSQKEDFIEKHKAAYTSFGIPASFLELLPFVGIFFAFTNTCGAALWASDLELKRGGNTAPNLRAQIEVAEEKE
ncbi:hypothetical protein BLS_006278 [Venturia inaequalis]|uniref:Outer spore wall protein RRT8 n=1 Tax=Venturia inaequalis TaxID=5025 RepID=A0A8H3UCQ7_VENIN|nr:hypothetical protein BLS_006278 [Venturia inaequalis]KAE9988109.1 hypothetical protein EG328_000579 [Venturia inaequalis]